MISDQQFASLQAASAYLSNYCTISSARVTPVQSSPPYSFVYKLEENSNSIDNSNGAGSTATYLVRIAMIENNKYRLSVINENNLSHSSANATSSSNLEDITAAANAAIAAAAAASSSSNNNNNVTGAGPEPSVTNAVNNMAQQQQQSSSNTNNANSLNNAINSAAAGDIFNLIQSIAANATANANNMNNAEQLLLLMSPQQKAIYKLILELSASNNTINVPFIKQVLLHRYPQLATAASSNSNISNNNTDGANVALDSDIDYCLKLISQVSSAPSMNKGSSSSNNNIASKMGQGSNDASALMSNNPNNNNIDPAIASTPNNNAHLKLDNAAGDTSNIFGNSNSIHNMAAAAAAHNAVAVRAAAAINAVSNSNTGNVLGYPQMTGDNNNDALPVSTSSSNAVAINSGDSSSGNTYMIEPPKEQTFNSMEEAKEYLQNYMKITGVGLVIYKSGKNRGYALYRCERGGDPSENLTKRRSSVKELHANANLNSEGILVDSISGKVIKKRNRKSRKMGCLFKVHIKLEKKATSQQNDDGVKSENGAKDSKKSNGNGTPEGIYRLTVPCAVHNHPLVGDSIKDHPILRKRTSEHLNFLAMRYIEALYHAVRDPAGAVENPDHNPSGLAGVRPGTMKQLMKERFPDLSIIDKDIYNDLRKIKEQIKAGVYGQQAQENLKKVTLLLSASNNSNNTANNHKMPTSLQEETKTLIRDSNNNIGVTNGNNNSNNPNLSVAAQQAAEVAAAAAAAAAAVQQHQIQQAQQQQLQMQLQQQAQHEMLSHPLSSSTGGANTADENDNANNNHVNSNDSGNVTGNNGNNDVQGAINEITDGNIDSAFLMENINNGDDNNNNKDGN